MPALVRRPPAGVWSAVLALLTLLAAAHGGAQEPCRSAASVSVLFAGDPWPPELQRDASADLEAGLRLRGIELCTPFAREPAARIVLQLFAADRMRVSIDVQDAITSKRVLRDIALAGIAQDARPLALAQATDELLRASWVELTMHDAPEPAQPPPPAIKRAVQPPAAAASERLQVLGARFAGELYTGGIKLLGADAVVAFWVAPRLGVSVQMGLRTGIQARADHGTIDVSALTASAGVIVPVWQRTARYNLLVGAGGHVAQLTLTGRGPSDVRAQSQATFIASARLGLSAVFSLSEALRLDLSAGAGLPLRRAVALDSDRAVISTRGVELHGSLGLGGMF